MTRHTPPIRGYTLVEVLLVVLLVGILVGLTAPALSRAKFSARRAASLSNLQSHVRVFASYLNDSRDVYPYLTDPSATFSVLRCGDLAVPVVYFEAAAFWNIGVADAYYNGDCHSAAFNPPGLPGLPGTLYYYSSSFLSAPEFWNPQTRIGPAQWRAVRAGEVIFPSLKGVLWNRAAFPGVSVGTYRTDLAEAAMVDGSALAASPSTFLPGYRNGEGPYPGTHQSGYGLPVLHTVDGVRGRDR